MQRPGIAEQMARDLRNSYRLAWLVEKTPWGRTSGARHIIVDVHAVTFEELDPAREAWQQDRFRQNIGAFGDNSLITAPEVYWDHCGPRVICMERVYGVPMDDFDTIAAMGVDAQLILRWGAKVWAEAVMVHGPFHGDMHAGNVWALQDGRGCYLDFGIMGELEDEWKQVLKDLFYTCSFDLDFTRVAAAYRRVGVFPAGAGSDEEIGAFLNSILGPVLRAGYSSINIGQLVTQSLDLLKAFDAVAPRQLVLIAKQLLYIDRYARHLAPDYTLTSDPLIVKNIFPAEAAAKAAELGVSLDDLSTALLRPAEGAAEPATGYKACRETDPRPSGVVPES
ncbi:MAG TPA: AarF/UbiB family protein [Acidimicrobiales bacterium]|nr:AarF/UbiB family protein [Acidimicrobiales bacterium]